MTLIGGGAMPIEVLLVEDSPGDVRLVGYAIAAPGTVLDTPI